MKEQFVAYEIALKLKELGFNEECFGYYDSSNYLCIYQQEDYFLSSDSPNIQVDAPLWQQAIDWLRITKKIDIQILRNKPNYHEYKVEIYKLNNNDTYLHLYIKDNDGYIVWFTTYEEAREQAILTAIELVENE